MDTSSPYVSFFTCFKKTGLRALEPEPKVTEAVDCREMPRGALWAGW